MFTTISKVFSKLYFWTYGGAGSRKSGDRGDFNPSSGENKWGIRGERLCLCVCHVCPVCLCLLPVFLLTCLITITPVSIHPDKRPTRPSRLGQSGFLLRSAQSCLHFLDYSPPPAPPPHHRPPGTLILNELVHWFPSPGSWALLPQLQK